MGATRKMPVSFFILGNETVSCATEKSEGLGYGNLLEMARVNCLGCMDAVSLSAMFQD